jgi:pimeloyl-ACP methyl ester carboxylesterase
MKRKGNEPADPAQHAAAGVRTEVSDLNACNGVVLRLTTFVPANGGSHLPVLFIPGLGSVMENFSGTLKGLTAKSIVYFVETREKPTSKFTVNGHITLRDIANDISGSAMALGLKEGAYVLAGYSLGATAAAECFRDLLKIKPALLVLAEPAGSFDFSNAEIFIARTFWPLYPLLKPLIKFYLRTFRMNASGDREMYNITRRVIDSADPRKLAAAVCGIAGYSVYSALPEIDVPVLLIGVSSDKMHGHDEPSRMAAMIPDAEYVDLIDNTRSHSTEVADLIFEKLPRL